MRIFKRSSFVYCELLKEFASYYNIKGIKYMLFFFTLTIEGKTESQ